MAHQKPTIHRASRDELTSLQVWHELAGIEISPPDVQHFVNAHDSGVLGAALRSEDLGTIVNAMPEAPDVIGMLLSRTFVGVARRGDEPIGMVIMGPPSSLYRELLGMLGDQAVTDQKLFDKYHFGTLVLLSKLELVCVAPEHRG